MKQRVVKNEYVRFLKTISRRWKANEFGRHIRRTHTAQTQRFLCIAPELCAWTPAENLWDTLGRERPKPYMHVRWDTEWASVKKEENQIICRYRWQRKWRAKQQSTQPLLVFQVALSPWLSSMVFFFLTFFHFFRVFLLFGSMSMQLPGTGRRRFCPLSTQYVHSNNLLWWRSNGPTIRITHITILPFVCQPKSRSDTLYGGNLWGLRVLLDVCNKVIRPVRIGLLCVCARNNWVRRQTLSDTPVDYDDTNDTDDTTR